MLKAERKGCSMTLSAKLQNLRRAARLSQEQLAEQLGVTRQAVSKWETGEGKPDIDNLLPLARLLHTTVDYLLDDGANQPRAEEPQPQTPPQQSVGRELWEQLKTFGRRWGWLGGYAIAAIGAVRLVTIVATIVIFVRSSGRYIFGDLLDFEGEIVQFMLGYMPPLAGIYVVAAIYILIYLAMIVGGIWLARWLKRKYAA